MDFAKNLLGKYGWKEGDGLGRNRDGMSIPLKAAYKFDKTGLGHNKADEINNHWWENVYNTAAGNLDINKNENGVSMALKGESVDITTKSYSIKNKEKSKSMYAGQFLKTSTLVNSGAEVQLANKDTVDIVPTTCMKIISDEELFKACQGRTAHKGARHGLKSSGKLARIEAQEQEMLERLRLAREQPSTSKGLPSQSETIIEWIESKGRKHRSRKDGDPLKRPPVPVLSLNNEDDEQDKKLKSVLYQNEYQTKPKKKRKHEQRIEEELSAALASISTSHGKAKKSKHNVDGDNLHTVAPDSKAIKKKKSKRNRSPVVHEIMEKKSDFIKRLSIEEIEVEFSEKKSSKKRKRKRNDDDNMSLDSYRGRSNGVKSSSSGDDDVVTKRITKKLKKKLGFVAESNKKVLVEELTEFQKKHFVKSKIPVVEISSVSKAKRLRHMKNANNLATQLEDSMQL